MQLAVDSGAIIKSSVGKKLCYLVKGTPVPGFEISSKEQKALDLIEEGAAIQIIDEAEFLSLLHK